MNSRRSFLGKVAGAVATVAVAPALALKAKPYWIQDQCHSRCFDDAYLTYVSNQNGIYAQLGECSHEFDIVERGDYYVMEILNK